MMLWLYFEFICKICGIYILCLFKSDVKIVCNVKGRVGNGI